MDVSIAQSLSPRVEEAIKKVLGTESDELDGPSFDAVEFVNRKFAEEKSLDALDRTISDFDYEIRTLDSSIFETVREQSTAGQVAAKDISDAKDSIGDLHAKIIEIKKKAEASEQMVQEICRDIKQLDVAKRHLTDTIMTIARLKTLTSAVQQLQMHAGRRAYDEAAPLLEAAIQLFTYFTEYSRLPKVSELASAVEAIRNELKEAITEDFDILLDTATPTDLNFETASTRRAGGDPDAGVETKVLSLDDLKRNAGEDATGARALTDDNIVTLQSGCECIDALGPTVRKALLKSFNRKQLKPYGRLFGRGAEHGDSLEGIEKRYGWFRKSLRDLDDKYGRVLPKRWRVQHRLCIEFCEATRLDIERILSSFDPPSSVPAEPLLRALLKTIAFEKEMAKKFEADLRKEGTIDDETLGGGRGRLGSSGLGGREEDNNDPDDERYDESAPLYNDKGELVDPSTAEGIRLKYKRKKEFEERRSREAERKAQRAQQRALIAQLAGAEPVALGNRGAGSPAKVTASLQAIGRASLDDEVAALPKISQPGEGLISSAFKPYMTAYVKFERSNIDNIVAQTTAEDMSATDSSSTSASILRSAAQLFAQARNSIMRCVQLNTGQTLFELCGEIRDSLIAYADKLTDRLPKPQPPKAEALPGDTYGVTESDGPGLVDTLCLIINTSEYCAETVPKFVESVQKVLDSQYREHVGMDAVQEAFYGLTAGALKALSGVVACMLDSALSKLSKAAWTTLTDVGDASPYVSDIARGLKLSFPVARKRLDESLFRSFCDKFIRAFVPRYQASIYRAKKIGETGAQQLLMDAQSIKEVLLQAPTLRPASEKFMTAIVKARSGGAAPDIADLDDDGGHAAASGSGEDADGMPSAPAGPPPVYVKFVQKEVPRVEMLLKIVSTPRDRFADTIKALWSEASVGDVTKVMDLKTMPKKEQTDVLVALGLAKPNALAGLGVPMTMTGMGMGGMGASNPFASTAGASSAGPAGASSAGQQPAGGSSAGGGGGGGIASLGSGINLTGGLGSSMGGVKLSDTLNVGKLFGGNMMGKAKK